MARFTGHRPFSNKVAGNCPLEPVRCKPRTVAGTFPLEPVRCKA